MKRKVAALVLSLAMVISPMQYVSAAEEQDQAAGQTSVSAAQPVDEGSGETAAQTDNTESVKAKAQSISVQAEEFVVEDGVLTAYNGSSADVVIPDGVTKIGDNAFNGKTFIQTVKFPDSVTEIGTHAFYGCSGLKEVRLPKNLTTLGYQTFVGTGSLEYVWVPKSLNQVVTTMPGESGGITMGPFGGSYNGMRAEFEEGTTQIADFLFYRSQLSSVSLPDTVSTIGVYAFSATQLKEIDIPASVQSAQWSFANCGSLTNIHFAEGTTQVGERMFSGNFYLETVEFPDTIEKIDTGAFSECENLKNIKWPANLREIGDDAFSGCTALTEVKLPDQVEVLGGHAFGDCTGITSLYLPKTIKEAGWIWEYGDEGYLNIAGPFDGCSALEEVTFAEGTEQICGMLLRETGLKEITVPDTVKFIGKFAFENCEALERVIIPDSVTEIEHQIISGSTRAVIICSEGSAAHEYAIKNSLAYSLELGHEHSFGEWEVYQAPSCGKEGYERRYCSCGAYEQREIAALEHQYDDNWTIGKEPTCTEDGERARYCINCGEGLQKEVIPKLGHDFSTEWTVDKEPTCTEAGERSHHCTRCAERQDIEKVDALGHKYGEWIIDENATYFEEGKQHRVCERCDSVEEAVIPKLEADFDAHPDYSFAEVQVVDAQTLEPVNGAKILVSNGTEKYETVTEESGKAKLFIPHGTYDFLVQKEGYMLRSFEYNLETGEVFMPQIGISQGLVVQGELTVNEMTKEEIEDAGIDMDATGNNQVFKYEVKLHFTDGLEQYEIPLITYKDKDGKELGFSLNGQSSEQNEYTFTAGDSDITITRVSESMYMIVQGETKWLKEMFHVQLVVVNTSLTDELTDCVAELVLPNGLSLADMIQGSQSERIVLGEIGKGEVETVDWYIRGDKAGDYKFGAALEGKFSSLGDEFSYLFELKDPLHVYAGSDMELTVHVSDAAYYGEPYTMIFELENVSDHTIYNVSHKIQKMSQYQVTEYTWIEDGKVVDSEEVWKTLSTETVGEDGIVTREEFKPGEKLAVLVKTNVLWRSPLERLKQSSSDMKMILQLAGMPGQTLSAVLNLISYIDVRYYLTDTVVSTLEGSTAQIPVTFDIEHHGGVLIYEKILKEALGTLWGDGKSAGIKYFFGDNAGMVSGGYSLFKQMKTHLEITSADPDCEYIAWVETADGDSDVISISSDKATVDGDGNLVFKGDTEISVDALNTGEAYLFVKDENGNVTKQQFNVKEQFPGQDKINSDLNILEDTKDLIFPKDSVFTKDYKELLDMLGFDMTFGGKVLEDGDEIPTGTVIADRETGQIIEIVVPGDANSDAEINLFDGFSILGGNHLLTPIQMRASSFTDDDIVDENDTEYLYNYLTDSGINSRARKAAAGKLAKTISLAELTEGISGVRGVQLDITGLTENGITDVSAWTDAAGDFSRSVYNAQGDYVRTIAANYSDTLDTAQGSITIQYNTEMQSAAVPAKLYIQTENETIVKDLELAFTNDSQGGDEAVDQAAEKLNEKLDQYEDMIGKSDVSDEAKDAFLKAVEEIREALKNADSVGEITELEAKLQQAYEEFQKAEDEDNSGGAGDTGNNGGQNNKPGDQNNSGSGSGDKNGGKDQKDSEKTPDTGDHAEYGIWLLMMAFSAAAVVGVMRKKRGGN